jgi:pimeloyl-ACP methyl ester carboxylesterase
LSTFVTSDGVRLALRVGEGRPMVFQHGLCGDAGQPAQVFPDDTGFGCVTLECRGHGASEVGPVAAFSLARFAEDLAAMMDARGLSRVVVGGISMGAALALRLAVVRPDLVGALVLARPAWGVAAGPVNMQPNAVVGQLLAEHAPAEAWARFEASALARQLAAEAPDNLASLRGFFARRPIEVTSALLTRFSGDGPGVAAADLAALQVPTLVIGHAQDHVHPLSLARDLAGLIPRARLVQITPKAADPVAYRDDFRAALAAFLKGC